MSSRTGPTASPAFKNWSNGESWTNTAKALAKVFETHGVNKDSTGKSALDWARSILREPWIAEEQFRVSDKLTTSSAEDMFGYAIGQAKKAWGVDAGRILDRIERYRRGKTRKGYFDLLKAVFAVVGMIGGKQSTVNLESMPRLRSAIEGTRDASRKESLEEMRLAWESLLVEDAKQMMEKWATADVSTEWVEEALGRVLAAMELDGPWTKAGQLARQGRGFAKTLSIDPKDAEILKQLGAQLEKAATRRAIHLANQLPPNSKAKALEEVIELVLLHKGLPSTEAVQTAGQFLLRPSETLATLLDERRFAAEEEPDLFALAQAIRMRWIALLGPRP